MGETKVLSLGLEDPLEKGMATHSSILAWRIPWTEEPGGLQPMGSQRVGHDWVTNNSFRCKQILRVRIKGETMILQGSTLYFEGVSLSFTERDLLDFPQAIWWQRGISTGLFFVRLWVCYCSWCSLHSPRPAQPSQVLWLTRLPSHTGWQLRNPFTST